MLDVKCLRQQLEETAQQLARRGFTLDSATFLSLDQKRKVIQTETESLQAKRNGLSKKIYETQTVGEDAKPLLAQVAAIKESLKQNDIDFANIQKELLNFQLSLPNIPDPSVPQGNSASDNPIIRQVNTPRTFTFPIQDHVSLGEAHHLMDFETATHLAGSRFVVLRGSLAKLERALSQWMLDVHVKNHGYIEVSVPYLASENCLFNTGQLPKFRDDQFKIENTNLFLIPTAEVPLTNLMQNRILSHKDLPLKWVAHTPCFRAEAGSYGKDVRGMIRQHQFLKVELVQIVAPENSANALEEMVGHAERILQLLKLPYQVVELCTADLGFAATKTYDLEVWLPSQNTYREISSCSNFGDFQARRMQTRYRIAKENSPRLVHTLNGSALAVGRTLVAILENFQDSQGRIHIPEVLHPYMGGTTVIG